MIRSLLVALVAWIAGAAQAQFLPHDPPHDEIRNIECLTCHVPHGSPGGRLNRVAGNANVCLTCHVPTGQASNRPFAAADEALPPLPDPTGWTAGRGVSHRWDSGPSGHVKPAAGNTSSGRIASDGVFSGRIEEAYTITIAVAGQAGAATFNWTSLRDGSGAGIVSGTNVPIGSKGLTVTFANGAAAPSFRAGDQWTLYARTDLRLPVTTQIGSFEWELGARMWPEEVTGSPPIGGPKAACSTCHDQHTQQRQPFDPNAPAYAGRPSGWVSTGIGRHFQRQPNDSNQMCKVCHSARNVTSSAQGSHPVGIAYPPAAGDFKPANQLTSAVLSTAGNVECMTCHAPHYQSSGGANGGLGDGFLLRTGIGTLCFQCHSNADQATGSHFNATTGALWGGNRDRAANAAQRLDALTATTFPKHTPDKRGACVNCHWPHGWPDSAAPAQDYAKLWVERYDADRTGATDGSGGEALCFACHTAPVGGVPATPATSNLELEFSRGSPLTTATGDVFRHPVNDNEQQGARRVECVDCHNPHKATPADRHAGVSGVSLTGATLPAGTPLQQYELCFKCHGDTFNSLRPNTSNKRLDFNITTANSGYHPVTQAGRGTSANLATQLQLGGLTTADTIRCTDCHNSSSFSAVLGRIADSAAATVGPHGSQFAPILRANFSRNFTQTGWNNANADLCFRCHDPVRLLSRDQGSGARTNFSDESNPAGSRGKRNLHWYHLTDRSATASCMSCHYDIHSNRTAANTEYCVGTSITNCTVTTSPPANVKTHLINFAPDVTGLSFARPRWHINTSTGVRTCNLTCHGSGNKMDSVTYRPSAGDETSHTY